MVLYIPAEVLHDSHQNNRKENLLDDCCILGGCCCCCYVVVVICSAANLKSTHRSQDHFDQKLFRLPNLFYFWTQSWVGSSCNLRGSLQMRFHAIFREIFGHFLKVMNSLHIRFEVCWSVCFKEIWKFTNAISRRDFEIQLSPMF